MDRVPGWGQGGLLVIEHRAEIAHVEPPAASFVSEKNSASLDGRHEAERATAARFRCDSCLRKGARRLGRAKFSGERSSRNAVPKLDDSIFLAKADQRRHDNRGRPLGRPYGFCSG
jgi:hypothetical protein